MEWQKEKPDFACVFVTRYEGEYNLWRFTWEKGDPPEKATDEEETVYWYLAWNTNDGDEWDDINECDFDEYLVLEKLPDMETTHKLWAKSIRYIL